MPVNSKSPLARSAKVLAAGALAFLLVAMADSGPARDELLAEIQHLQDQLTARQGELELARIHLDRLTAIVSQSARHDIPADLASAIYDTALEEGVEPKLAFSLVRVESRFTDDAVSSAGAVGLTQVMPSTAFWLDPDIGYEDLFRGDTNLRLGFRYLHRMIRQYHGQLDLALLAYNRGPTRVDSIIRAGGNPSNGYERAVLRGAGDASSPR
jgi:soluble lytic murein transglycosylase-like protein